MERNPMDDGQKSTWDSQSSAYWCISLQPLWLVSTRSKHLSLKQGIIIDICVNRMARILEGEIKHLEGDDQSIGLCSRASA
jgi:hypothetical protein